MQIDRVLSLLLSVSMDQGSKISKNFLVRRAMIFSLVTLPMSYKIYLVKFLDIPMFVDSVLTRI